MTHNRLTFSTVAALAALLCSSAPSSGQSILKTAGNYSVLASQAITVAGTGFTITDGNIGLFPAATSNITGFPPGTVSGTTLLGTAAAIIATGGATQQAEADLQVAATGLAALPLTANYSNVDMANLGPLPPGVYKWNAAATLTGALVLDAQGRNNVYWVFQFGTGLTTAVNSTVTLINPGSNGGSDDGIFWNAATGAIVIGDDNKVLGNYIAYTSVSFTGSTQLLGNGGARFLALNAAVSFAGPGALNALGGPGGSSWTGGLTLNGSTVVATAVAPVITSPLTAAGTINAPFSYTIAASGSPTSYAASPLPAGLSIVPATGAITGTPTAAGSTAVVLSATNASGTSHATLTITVAPPGTTPIITNSPLTPAGTIGAPFNFAITASGTPTSYAASPLPAGLSIAAGTGAITGIPTASGVTTVLLSATNASGTGYATLTITVAGSNVAPIITSPASAPGAAGMPFVTYQITATGLPTNYTATGLPAGLTINPATGVINGAPTTPGTYTVSITATNAAGTTASTLTITVAPGVFSRIVDFSARAQAGSGSQTLILGFVVSGNNKALLVRGVGPALIPFGVANALPDPELTLYSGENPIASNTGWSTSVNAAVLASTAAQIGAFPLASGSADSALITVVSNGAYTAEIVGASGDTGTALAEVYDADSNLSARLVNASVRMKINLADGNLNPLTIGFVIAGNNQKTVLIRGIGPGLSAFGVAGVLANPQITLLSGNTQIATNANWAVGNNPGQIAAMFAQVGAFPLTAGSLDAALTATLQPGTYTVQIIGVGNTAGIALLEIYDVQ